MKNDADVMSAVSDIRSPAAATSNFRSLVTAASSDQKKAKRQAHDKKKTDPKKLKKQTSETAGHNVCLPKGDDDHNDFNDLDFIGREALRLIQRTGPQQLIRGVIFNGEKCPPCQSPWPILRDGVMVGQVTTAIWSPRFENNIALGMLERNHWQAGTEVTVQVEDGSIRNGMVTDLPMIDHCTG